MTLFLYIPLYFQVAGGYQDVGRMQLSEVSLCRVLSIFYKHMKQLNTQTTGVGRGPKGNYLGQQHVVKKKEGMTLPLPVWKKREIFSSLAVCICTTGYVSA